MRKQTYYTAFGETKSVTEWARDPRCRVAKTNIGLRVRLGWPPEAAICFPVTESRKNYDAFGEYKPLIHWLSDPRCATSASIVLQRLAAGEDIEAALTRPEPGHPPEVWTKTTRSKAERALKFEAFGEIKTMRGWEQDPRLSHPPSTLHSRVYSHLIPMEAALVFTEGELHRLHYAFGERKNLVEWLRDKRCTIPGVLLQARLANGEPLESAISRPVADGPTPPPAVEQDNRRNIEAEVEQLDDAYDILRLTLYGETKTASQWIKDPRCEVSWPTLSYRIKRGAEKDESILKLTDRLPQLKYTAITESGLELGLFRNHKEAIEAIEGEGGRGVIVNRRSGKHVVIPSPKPEPSSRRALQVTAWGETKSLPDWIGDSRCVANHQTVYRRLLQKGKPWTPEDALTTPARDGYLQNYKRLFAEPFTAFGETKLLTEWHADPRCEVSRSALAKRIKAGMPLQMAMRK